MFVVTNREMRDIDRYTIEQIGIPSAVLMENAGKTIVDWIAARYCKETRVGVICGKGNNGGDGLVIARYLRNRGYQVKAFVAAALTELSPDTALQYKIASRCGVGIEGIPTESDIDEGQIFKEYDLLIDALLGTGSQGQLRPLYQKIVRAINDTKANNSKVRVISVDNPTGVIGDHGEVALDIVKADVTLVLGYMKQSLVCYPVNEHTGHMEVLDIGFPKLLEQKFVFSKQLLTEDIIAPWIPRRHKNSHKGTYGKVRCIAGSRCYFGAGLLAATASLHVGAGLTYWDAPSKIRTHWVGQIPELIFTEHPSEDGHFSTASVQSLYEATMDADAVIVGCGITHFPGGAEWIESLLGLIDCPVVIDADAFTMLKDKLSVLKAREGKTVVTPHPGEFARVLGIPINELEKSRIDYCVDFAKEYQATLVLKGSHTTIATPCGKVYINTTGSHVLAKGGTGDVLAGFVGGLLAQGLSTEHAACVAIYSHGKVAEELSKKQYVSTMASDVSRNVGVILQNIANRA